MIDVAKFTCCGGHEINEDSYLVTEQIFAVADGLGGHENGEVASAKAMKCLAQHKDESYSFENIVSIMEEANKAVYDLNSPARTTIAAAFVENDCFRYINVGDSRVYYFKHGKLFAQTKDHSVCQAAVDMGTMKPEEIRTSEDRSKLLKVLGDSDNLNIKKNYPEIIVEDGDAFLICSDGFWEYVFEEEMEVDYLKSDSAKTWMSYLLKRQLLRAKDEGDNYTVICGIIRADEEKEPVKKGWKSLFSAWKKRKS